MQNKLFLKAADICELLEVKQTSASKRQVALFFQLLVQISDDLISRCLFYFQKFTYIGCL